MINTSELKGVIVSRGYSQRKIAHELGMTEKTFYAKMKKRFLKVMKLKK